MENVSDVEWQHCRRDDGKNENGVEGNEHDHRDDNAIGSDVANTFAKTGMPLRFFLSCAGRAFWKRNERDDKRNKGDRVGEKG